MTTPANIFLNITKLHLTEHIKFNANKGLFRVGKRRGEGEREIKGAITGWREDVQDEGWRCV